VVFRKISAQISEHQLLGGERPLFPFSSTFFLALPDVDTSAYDGKVFVFEGLRSNSALI